MRKLFILASVTILTALSSGACFANGAPLLKAQATRAIFITPLQFDGFVAGDRDADGLPAADLICQNTADILAAPSGIYRALLLGTSRVSIS